MLNAHGANAPQGGTSETEVEKIAVEGQLRVSGRYAHHLNQRNSAGSGLPGTSREHLEDQIAPYDYDAIIINRSKGDKPRGFGFSLMLGIDPVNNSHPSPKIRTPSGNVKLYGYSSEDIQPLNWEGSYGTLPDQVMYNMDTKPGLSGSPVFTGYKSAETVIAIQYVLLTLLPHLGFRGPFLRPVPGIPRRVTHEHLLLTP